MSADKNSSGSRIDIPDGISINQITADVIKSRQKVSLEGDVLQFFSHIDLPILTTNPITAADVRVDLSNEAIKKQFDAINSVTQEQHNQLSFLASSSNHLSQMRKTHVETAMRNAIEQLIPQAGSENQEYLRYVPRMGGDKIKFTSKDSSQISKSSQMIEQDLRSRLAVSALEFDAKALGAIRDKNQIPLRNTLNASWAKAKPAMIAHASTLGSEEKKAFSKTIETISNWKWEEMPQLFEAIAKLPDTPDTKELAKAALAFNHELNTPSNATIDKYRETIQLHDLGGEIKTFNQVPVDNVAYQRLVSLSAPPQVHVAPVAPPVAPVAPSPLPSIPPNILAALVASGATPTPAALSLLPAQIQGGMTSNLAGTREQKRRELSISEIHAQASAVASAIAHSPDSSGHSSRSTTPNSEFPTMPQGGGKNSHLDTLAKAALPRPVSPTR